MQKPSRMAGTPQRGKAVWLTMVDYTLELMAGCVAAGHLLACAAAPGVVILHLSQKRGQERK
jgi:hypothetical protein